MAEEDKSNQENFFEDIIKKTKTGVTFPKTFRDEMFEDDEDVFFRMIVPQDKDKIILEILSEDKVKELQEKLKAKKPRTPRTPGQPKTKGPAKSKGPVINWAEVFGYDFERQEEVRNVLESAFLKFAEKPINFEDAMGRVKYALISFLTSRKTDNAKLYFAVENFLIKIIEMFDQPNLIEWIFDKIIPNVESKFLYELALLELVEISLKTKRFEKAEIYIFHVLVNIDTYSDSEMYNILNSFKQLVKKVRWSERTTKIDKLLKEKLMEYGEGLEGIEYKIQIVEFLEDLKYIELGYKLAKEIQDSLPPESIRIQEVRKLVRRLHTAPIEEQKEDFA